jgi:uncharacterized membrane protein required for colicin V production
MLDIGLIISILVVSFYCVNAGVILAITDVIALIIGVFIAGLLISPFGGILTFISDERLAKLIAFIVVVIVVIIINEIFTKKTKIHEKLPIRKKWLDRLLAWIVGLVWGLILVSALMTVWVGLYTDMLTSTNIKDSVVMPVLTNNIPVASLLPQEFKNIGSYFK